MQPQAYSQTAPVNIGHLIAAEIVPLAARPPYDFSGLGKLAKDAGFVREMQQMFIDQVPVQIAQLKATIEVEDWVTIAHQAHSLKSTFGNLRIEPSAGLLKEMENIAFQHRDKLELLAILQVVATTTEVVVRLFEQELSLAA
ncbi:Hpt domain-containing protein [Hymenobacter terricola]|uniref:Hpt domain-containing protein n=1 Tax=Hymenobacter terricola TaxID=2819236 RepID=UPI001B31846B|nr:Hpt domain-containing protein [Hymenobacter terricola]